MENLFTDVDGHATMFRIVCKSNLTRGLAEDLCERFVEVLYALDSLKDGYQSLHSLREEAQEEIAETALVEGLSKHAALAATDWLAKARSNIAEKKARPNMARRRSISHAVC